MIDNPKKYRFMDMVNLLKDERGVEIVLVDCGHPADGC
jgi:hypothetical protein